MTKKLKDVELVPKHHSKKGFVEYYKHSSADKCIIVNFEDYFDTLGIERFDKFYINNPTRRTYNKNGSKMAAYVNDVLNHHYVEKTYDIKSGGTLSVKRNYINEVSEQFLYRLLSIKIEIDNKKGFMNVDSYVPFLAAVNDVITEDLVKLVRDYIDVTYTKSLLEKSIEDGVDLEAEFMEASDEVRFDDEDVKVILYGKYLGNMIIPLAAHYINHFSGSVSYEVFFKDVYEAIYIKSSKYSDRDPLQKIFKYVSNNVGKAFKISPIYRDFEINGVTRETKIDDTYAKILTTGLIKLENQGTVPAFIFAFIRKQIMFYSAAEDNGYVKLTRFDDELRGGGGGEDSVVTESERIESTIRRPDKQLQILNKAKAKRTLSIVSLKEGIPIASGNRLGFTIKNLVTHKVQERVITQLFSDYYGGWDNILDINKEDYTCLLLLAEDKLRANGLNILADIIVGRYNAHKMQHPWGKIADRSLYSDERYLEIIDSTYRAIKPTFSDPANDFIRSDIITIVNSEYLYGTFGSAKYGKHIIIKPLDIMSEILNYYVRCID